MPWRIALISLTGSPWLNHPTQLLLTSCDFDRTELFYLFLEGKCLDQSIVTFPNMPVLRSRSFGMSLGRSCVCVKVGLFVCVFEGLYVCKLVEFFVSGLLV